MEDRTAAHVVRSFFAHAVAGDVDSALVLVDHAFVGHGSIAGGRDGLAAFLRELARREPAPRIVLYHVLDDGGLVALHYHSSFGPEDQGREVIDLFDVADGLITRHWDVVTPRAALRGPGGVAPSRDQGR